MAEIYDMLMDVNPTKLQWNFKGGRIRASIPKPLVKKWRKTFSFKPIVKLLQADKIDDSILIDVIGEVVGKEDPRELITNKGRETKRLAILIEDLENNSIECVLFGNMVDQILPYLKGERVEPLIVIAQCFRPNKWNEKTSVQSHFEYSKLRINPDLEEVRDFSNKFKVEVMTCDRTGSITLLMWDRETIQLCGRQADQIKNEVYTVMKICDDEEIIEMNHPKKIHNLAFDVITDNRCSDSINVSAVLANMQNDTDSIFSMCHQPQRKNPAKRAIMEMKQSLPINIDNEDELGFFTNKFSRKGGKRHKMHISESDN
ncbi:hypothetical protein Ahy_A03g012457 [Arachis hypogaea]|uniref:DUF223 domain-containing protein n=1 Tax=Arachis hypogaea TaxID=3818 RepID=A0A445DTF9_ARAHY|nr:hypothetical protein Ahy_A03g012457 [Arachis hypogaea]